MEPVSGRYVVRPGQLLTRLTTPPAPPGPTTRRPGSGPAGDLARRLGLTWTPRHTRTVFAPGGASSAGPARLRAGARVLSPLPEVLSETAPLPRLYSLPNVGSQNYVGWLGRASAADVAGETLQPRPDTLLYLLLRHASLLERAAGVATSLAALQESLGHLSGLPSAALARLLGETLDLCSHRLDAWVTSLATRRLEWLRAGGATGTYLGGYGCVEDLGPGPQRVPLPWGAPRPLAVPPREGPPGETTPLYFTESSAGYVHAPSLAHATTAAILRSGYLSRRASGDGTALAVDLSSDRVRLAQWLLDGVRQGQGLASLLGYRFERGLYESAPGGALAPYVHSFRRLAPLDVPPPPGPDAPDRAQRLAAWKAMVAARPAGDVVDGLALLRRTQAPSGSPLSIPWGPAGDGLLPASGTDAYRACERQLETIAAALDAVDDLLVAEAVHQTAQGNPARAGATLDAVGQGEAPPPEMAVARIPRSGTGVTHRLAVLFNAPPQIPPGWPAPSARAAAEPLLNAWAARLLGPAAPAARCLVEYLDPLTGAVLMAPQEPPPGPGPGPDPEMALRAPLEPRDPPELPEPPELPPVPVRRDVSLAELGLSPIDLLALPEETAEAGRSELEQRLVYLARRNRPPRAPEGAGVRLSFAREPGAPLGTMSVPEVLEVARTARRLLTSARALTAADLALPDATLSPQAEDDPPLPAPPAPDPELPYRLERRATDAVTAFRAAALELQGALPAQTPPPPPEALDQAIDPELLRPRLLRLAGFGIPGAVPTEPVGATPTVRRTLRLQAESVAREADARIVRLNDLDRAFQQAGPATPSTAREYHLARLQEVFGAQFRVLPRFLPANGADLRQALDGASGQGAGPAVGRHLVPAGQSRPGGRRPPGRLPPLRRDAGGQRPRLRRGPAPVPFRGPLAGARAEPRAGARWAPLPGRPCPRRLRSRAGGLRIAGRRVDGGDPQRRGDHRRRLPLRHPRLPRPAGRPGGRPTGRDPHLGSGLPGGDGAGDARPGPDAGGRPFRPGRGRPHARPVPARRLPGGPRLGGAGHGRPLARGRSAVVRP